EAGTLGRFIAGAARAGWRSLGLVLRTRHAGEDGVLDRAAALAGVLDRLPLRPLAHVLQVERQVLIAALLRLTEQRAGQGRDADRAARVDQVLRPRLERVAVDADEDGDLLLGDAARRQALDLLCLLGAWRPGLGAGRLRGQAVDLGPGLVLARLACLTPGHRPAPSGTASRRLVPPGGQCSPASGG